MATGKMIMDKIQLGQEAVAGDSANDARAATTILHGSGVMSDASVHVNPDDRVGLAIRTTEQFTPMKGTDIAITNHYASFEQLDYFLQGAIKSVSGVQDGTGSGYVRTYPIPTAIQDITDFQTFIVEGGDNNQEYQAAYAFIEEFNMSMKKGDSWMRSATMRAQAWVKGSFTGSLTRPTVEKMLGSKTKLYIDAVSGSFGATAVPDCTLLSAEMKIVSGLQGFSGNSDLTFACAEHTGPVIQLDVTFRYDSNAVAQADNFEANTPVLVQLTVEGSDLTTPDTYSKKTFIAKLSGVWNSFAKDGNEGGVNLAKGTLFVGYDPTAATAGEFITVNELSTLP